MLSLKLRYVESQTFVKKEFGRPWKEVLVVCAEVLFQHLPQIDKENLPNEPVYGTRIELRMFKT